MGEPAVVVGAVTKAHGLRGEVGVQVRSDNPERFAPGSHVFLAEGRRLTVERAHAHGKALLVKFTEIADRAEAEGLRGQELQVPESWLPPLPDGEYWPFQIHGCRVTTESGRELGTVAEIVPNPANDLWIARDDTGTETLIPALNEIIALVDVGAKRILVRDLPGLTAPDED